MAYRQPLHGLLERPGVDDIYAGIKLLIASFIVPPLLPDEAIDPWNALNIRISCGVMGAVTTAFANSFSLG